MVVQEAWKRLRTVRELSFASRSRPPSTTGWNGRGEGTVQVEEVDASTTIFSEKGLWTPEIGRPANFTNVYRWTLAADGAFLRLEHLRFGVRHPVYLFDLVALEERTLASSTPHVCREDCYTARMEFDAQAIRLNWTITGPKKNETIEYSYR